MAHEPVEGPWDLPDGWRWEPIDAVAPVNPARKLDGLSDEVELVFLPMAAVAELSGQLKLTERRPVSALRNGFTRFRSGDVIFAKITPCMENGKLAIIPEIPHGMGAGSTEFHVLEATEVEPRFLFHWLSQEQFRNQAEHNMTGTAGQKRVPTDWLRQAPIPVPPLDTQRRIVARIDALFAEIGAGEEALASARGAVETWRKSLLKAAVTGDLTADWRRENPPQETGEQLLQRILTDRRARWHADPRNARKRYKPPTLPDTTNLPDLPEGWTWASLQQVAFISGGATVDKKRKPNDPVEVPYLRVANVQRGKLNLSVLKTILIDRPQLADLLLKPGDILLNEGGDRDKVGRGWVWEGQVEVCVHQNHVFKARPVSEAIQPFLTSKYMNELGRKFFLYESKQTTNLASISLSKVSRAPVPIPPAAEADAIAAILEEIAMNEVGECKIEALGDTVRQLRQSVLAAAFRGELVE